MFVDAGTVFDNKAVPTDSKETIRSSYGFGLKFYTVIGPIGLTWGFPITKESYDRERRFIFSIGNLNWEYFYFLFFFVYILIIYMQ